MPKIAFASFANSATCPPFNTAMFGRVSSAPLPKGLTLHRAVENWMKTNCAGTWSIKKVSGQAVMAVFFDPADYANAMTHFVPNKPWSSAHPADIGGFFFS